MSQIDQSYDTGNDNDDVGNLRRGSNIQTVLGQSFTPSVTAPVSSVQLYLKKKGAPTGNIWLEIHADGADPTSASQQGSDSELVSVSGLSTSFDWVTFTFTVPINLTASTEYWILLYGDYTETSDVGAIWGTDTSSPSYSGGIAGRYGNGGSAWEDISTYDRLFREYRDEISSPSVSVSRSPSLSPSVSVSRSPSLSPSITPSLSISRSPSSSQSPSASISASNSPSPSASSYTEKYSNNSPTYTNKYREF